MGCSEAGCPKNPAEPSSAGTSRCQTWPVPPQHPRPWAVLGELLLPEALPSPRDHRTYPGVVLQQPEADHMWRLASPTEVLYYH